MQDLQGFQYYDPSPLPTPEPWWQQKRTWRTVGAILAFAVVVAFTVVGTSNLLKNRKLSENKDVMNQVAAMELQLSSTCELDDQACLDRARADAARSLGAAQACDSLQDESLVACVKLIARDQKDPEVCQALPDVARQECADTAFLLKAKSSGSLSDCGQIKDQETQDTCELQVKNQLVAAGLCADAGVDQSVCDAQVELDSAVALGDASVCEALADDGDKYKCNYLITTTDGDRDGLALVDETSRGLSDKIADGDSDGLSDGDEVHVHATNPANLDTDGDGFSDGTEVASGYDPLK